MDTQTYLARIKYNGEVRTSHAVLSALQEAHLCSVPFENLDIHVGRRIVLDPARLYKKIVTMRRGGFCYELNTMFHWLLRELGFQVHMAMGRVFDRSTNTYGPAFDHMLLLVEIDGQRWLTDVGFGDFSLQPLNLVLDHPLHDPCGEFLIHREDSTYFCVSRYSPAAGRHVPEYLFSAQERQLEEFSAMCLFHQTSPASHFTRGRVCSIATPRGRTTLTDEKLIVTEAGRRREFLIRNEDDFRRKLHRHFNIHLS